MTRDPMRDTLKRISIAQEADGRVWIVINGMDTVGVPSGDDADRLLRWERDRIAALTKP